MKFKRSLASALSTALFIPYAFSPCSAIADDESAKSKTSGNTCESAKNPGNASPLMDFTFNGEKIQSNADTSKIKLDLFEGDNLNIALIHGLEFIIGENSSPYINDKKLIVGGIRANRSICENLNSIVDYVKTKKENDNDKNLEILKKLHALESMMKHDKNIPDDNVALGFISAMKSAYQAVISRSVAISVLEDNREKIESKMSSQSYYADSELSAGIPSEGFNMSLSAGLSTNQQSTETSFYKIDNSGNLGLSIGAGLTHYLSLNAACSFEITNSLIFYSLEEFLDAGMDKGNISFLKLKDDDLKKVISSRKKMQDDETAIMIKLKTSIEPFLKSANIVPQNLTFKIPEPTCLSIPEKSNEFSINSKLSAETNCLLAAGMTVSKETSFTKIKSYHPYLELVDKNFLITNYCTDIDDLITYLKISDTSKYKEIKKFFSCELPNANMAEIFSIIIANLIGDLKRYNAALTIIADDTSGSRHKSDARNVKKYIESNWVGTSFSSKSKHGRKTMLKIAIALGAYLRALYPSDDNNELFSSLYNEVENLSLFQKFNSKLFFETKQGFNTSITSNKISVTGTTYLDIPFVGRTNLTVSRSDTKSPLYTDNCQDITVTTQLPIINGKYYGSDTLREKLRNLISIISKTNDAAALTLADSLSLIEKEFDNTVSSYGIEKTLYVPKVFSIINYVNLHFYFTKVPKTENPNELIPLPDNNLIEKDKDSVILKLTKRIDSRNTDLKIISDAVDIKASNKFGKASSKIGTDSLMFITKKFNALELSENLAASANLWNKFKQGQKNSLEKLFINMTNDDSNAKYELQNIYSLIIKNIKSKHEIGSTAQSSLITATEHIFRNFLVACEKLKDSESSDASDQSYETASNLLDSILKLNYEFVWYPALVAANSK